MNKTHEASVRQWHRLHDKGYFENHRHSRGWPLAKKLESLDFNLYLNLQPDDDVLEIGCGFGSVLNAVADNVRSVVGVDIHDEPLSRARDFLRSKTNVRVILTDGMSLPFGENAFSAVYSKSVMQHIPRSLVRIYIEESRRVLKLRGRLCMQFPDANKRRTEVSDIDTTKILEQSIAWTSEELLDIVQGVDLEIEIHELPPRSLYLFAIAI